MADLSDEIIELDRAIKSILDAIARPLLDRHGVGDETAGALLVTAGDNPERIGSEKSFAGLCGASPVEISRGNTNRHHLNRAGDRHANSALWIIAMVRIRSRHAPTIAYLERRTTEGLSKRDIIRCLKRYIAREIFDDITTIIHTHTVSDTGTIAA